MRARQRVALVALSATVHPLENAARFYPGPPDTRMLSGRVIASRKAVAIDDAWHAGETRS